MECPPCKHELSFEEHISILNNRNDGNTALTFSPIFVLKNQEAFHAGVSSLLKTKKELVFFDQDHSEEKKFHRPVLLQAITSSRLADNQCEDCRRSNISLIEMKSNHIYKDQQLTLRVVTQPEPTNLIDGTAYLIVRDQFDFHIRLIISNWSYVTPTNESKSREEVIDILNELLPVESTIKLYDPLLTTCHIDGQLSLRCDAPNIELVLSDRIKKNFVHDKLDEVRERGNQAYIRGHFQLALDYYTFAIDRIIAMARVAMSNDNECEMNLFQSAFQSDLCRLHSNRSACYLQQRLYSGAKLDSFVVVTGGVCNKTFDDFFLKCLYRLICATIGSQEFTLLLESFFELAQNLSINFNLRMRYSEGFNQLRLSLPRLKDEIEHGKYDLKEIFNEESIDQTSCFDVHLFHCDFNNDSCVRKRKNSFVAKCPIPAGTLLVVQHAFAFVKSTDDNYADRRLINEIEKRLIMSPTAWEFDSIRMMPSIDQWFENETDADEDDYETYPKALPWGLLRKAQEENPFRSKSIVGWWPKVSVFKIANESKQKKGNCLWFICGKIIFLFTFVSLNKNDEFLIANNYQIRSLLTENQKQFTFLLGNNKKIRLDEIFDQLENTQIYFDQ